MSLLMQVFGYKPKYWSSLHFDKGINKVIAIHFLTLCVPNAMAIHPIVTGTFHSKPQPAEGDGVKVRGSLKSARIEKIPDVFPCARIIKCIFQLWRLELLRAVQGWLCSKPTALTAVSDYVFR